MDKLSDIPKGAQCFIEGQYYKIGRFNKIFVYRNYEWVFTDSRTMHEITVELGKFNKEDDSPDKKVWNVLGQEFSSAHDAAKKFGVKTSTIYGWCNGYAHPRKKGCFVSWVD